MPDTVPGFVARLSRDAPALLANVLPSSGVRALCIVTNGRAGSSLLVDLLDAHPRIRCHGEIFEDWHDYPYLLIRGRLRAARVPGLGAYAFKLNTNNLGAGWSKDSSYRARVLRPAPLIDRLHRAGTQFVHVRRRNIYQQTISSMRNAEHEQLDDGLSPAERPPVEIDPPTFIATMRRMEGHDANMAEKLQRLRTITVWYEDDLEPAERHQFVADEIFGALGLESHPVTTSRKKLATQDPAESIANRAAVEQAVRATRYATFLEGAGQ
jgi:hypothetical protein